MSAAADSQLPPSAAGDWLLTGALAFGFAPSLLALGHSWWSTDYLSHGFLVPAVAWAIAATGSKARNALPRSTDRRGLAVIAGAVLASLAGGLVGSVSLQGLGVVAAVTGAVWLRRGSAWLRSLAFPLAFLLVAVPPPPEWVTPLLLELQLGVSSAVVEVGYWLGIPVLREGNVLQIPGGALEVANACSGVTSLFTLSAIALALAGLSLARWPARVALVAWSIPAALVGNLVRVLATVALASATSVERATQGGLHTLLGLSTYVVAVGLLLLGDALLRSRERRAVA